MRKFLSWLQGGRVPGDLDDWNAIGRRVAAANSAEITAFHEGRTAAPQLIQDNRGLPLAKAVLAEVVSLNRAGRVAEARGMYDPAHAPFIPVMEDGERGLQFCAILGADTFLVLQGTSYQAQTAWHIKGDSITEAPPLRGFAFSRNRRQFVAVHPSGEITLHDTYGAPVLDRSPALPGSAFVPQGLPLDLQPLYPVPGDAISLTHLAISDDGTRILLCDANRGVMLLHRTGTGWQTQLLYPSIAAGLEGDMRYFMEQGEVFGVYLDMVHAALSPDGRFAACGMQSAGHFVLAIEDPAAPQLHAHLGHLSEYPHDAVFSNDSTVAAFNSCHFYNGATFAVRLADVGGLVTPPYERQPVQTLLNDYLRVYASGYLPASMAGVESGAFLLAGSGFAACITPSGKVLWELGFGSSAGGVDVCPTTGRLLIASYSGMLHLLDPARQQEPLIDNGYKAPLELRRWIFWEAAGQPIAW